MSRPSHGRRSRMASPAAQGYGRLEEHEAAGSLYVPEEGLGLGELLDLVPLISCQSFVYLSHRVFFCCLCTSNPGGFYR